MSNKPCLIIAKPIITAIINIDIGVVICAIADDESKKADNIEIITICNIAIIINLLRDFSFSILLDKLFFINCIIGTKKTKPITSEYIKYNSVNLLVTTPAGSPQAS